MAQKRLIIIFLLIGELIIADEIKYINIGMLSSWFSSNGCEIEVGRTHKSEDQQDGFAYPALYKWQDMQAAKGLWIGATNYSDPLSQEDYNYKVVHIGPRAVDETLEILPTQFKLIGKFDHPEVVVNGIPASSLQEKDRVDEIDETIPTERMILNQLNTSMGITMTRKIYASSNPDHDNYFIYDYTFENTGLYDLDGNTHQMTLTDVIFFFQYRWAMTKYACAAGYAWAPQSCSWGLNTVNEVLHQAYGDAYNATYSWHGLSSMYVGNNIGAPNTGNSPLDIPADGFLGAPQFPGIVTLHADRSAGDKSNDPDQFASAPFFPSNDAITYQNNQFDAAKMKSEYQYMNQGLPEKTHAEKLNYSHNPGWQQAPFDHTKDDDALNSWRGGFSQGIGYGPYTIAPGESIHIVFAECVGSIDWQKRKEIGEDWYFENYPYKLPDGTTTNDKDQYKDAWVFTGRDSLLQTFDRARETWQNNLAVDPTPPPPDKFTVNSGGDRITLSWADNAESYSHFGGYEIYRQAENPDTTYQLIYKCGAGSDNPVANQFDDFDVEKGVNYYYYIQSCDDGSVNTLEPGKTIKSSLFWTRTANPTFLLKAPQANLKEIRIVPNPFNLARQNSNDRLLFCNLPPKCRIKIYSENGTHIRTIRHINNTGSAYWDVCTGDGDLVASGIYLAYFEVLEDYDIIEGMHLKKGDNIIKKIMIIR